MEGGDGGSEICFLDSIFFLLNFFGSKLVQYLIFDIININTYKVFSSFKLQLVRVESARFWVSYCGGYFFYSSCEIEF